MTVFIHPTLASIGFQSEDPNNFRLILQPPILLWLIYPWLDIFPNSNLWLGFNHLISAMNQFKPFYSSG